MPRALLRFFSFPLKRSLLLVILIIGTYLLASNILMVANPANTTTGRLWKNSQRFGVNRNSSHDGPTVNKFVPAYEELNLDATNESGGSALFGAVEESIAVARLRKKSLEEKVEGDNQSEVGNNLLAEGGKSLFREITEKLGINRFSEHSRTLTKTPANLDSLVSRSFLADWEIDNSVSENEKQLPLCPEISPELTGRMKQAVLLIPTLKQAEVIKSHRSIRPGGSWRPSQCRARHKVAIILPFRDRQSHLNRLLDYLIPMLQRQQLDFRFIVTEQYGHDLFNKGRIMNAAFQVAEQMGVDCITFHDVDMFPQDDRNSYGCSDQPRHVGAYVNSLGYELWYDYIVGGVLTIRCDHFRQVNGYSNMYWAWGGEDDDMGKRILANNFRIERPKKKYSKYTMLKHIKRTRTAPSLIYKLLSSAGDRWKTDGLSNNQWKIIKLTRTPLYYHLFVDVGFPPDEWRKT